MLVLGEWVIYRRGADGVLFGPGQHKLIDDILKIVVPEDFPEYVSFFVLCFLFP